MMNPRLSFVALALLTVAPVADAHERLLEFDGMGFGMDGDFNMTEFIDMLKDVNYTDIFDRCCPTNNTVLPGITQYDSTDTESCNCPVRNNETFATKWDESCSNKLGPKILSGETGVDMEKLFEMFEKFMNANYTDIYDRCCSSPDGTNAYDADPSSCKCPVRNSTEHMKKWEEKCENKFAIKAKDDFDFNFEVKNHTAVYMKCCPTQEGLPTTDYDTDSTACSCPVRQQKEFAEKWTLKCEDEYGPKAKEEMMELYVVAFEEQNAAATSVASSLFGAWAVIIASIHATVRLL